MTTTSTTARAPVTTPVCRVCGAEGRRMLVTEAGETCEPCFAEQEAQFVPATVGQRLLLLAAALPPWGIAGLLAVRESLPQSALDLRVVVAMAILATCGFVWSGVMAAIAAGQIRRDEAQGIRDTTTWVAGATLFVGGAGMLAVLVGMMAAFA